jgi:hypothetical protein
LKALTRAALAALLLLALAAGGCGGDPGRERNAPEYGPVVPGYSLARVDVDVPCSTVRETLGEPDEYEYKNGYVYAYFGRMREDASREDPEAWHYVVVMYDDGDQDLSDGDTVGQIEATDPYYGTTSGKNGLESTPAEMLGEFGEFDGTSTAEYEGKTYRSYVFTKRGFEFVAEEGADRVVTLVVTPLGGLKPARNPGKTYEVSSGDVFRNTGNEPIVAGASAAGIDIGDNFIWVKDLYGLPNLSGSLGEGLVYATYTGGTGSWKLNIYLEDTDQDERPGDYDVVISIAVRFPYDGRTAKGVGIGSKQADVSKEFGTPEFQQTANMGGEATQLWQYPSKGIVFAINELHGVQEIDVNRIGP